jgi:hypothetical protein
MATMAFTMALFFTTFYLKPESEPATCVQLPVKVINCLFSQECGMSPETVHAE